MTNPDTRAARRPPAVRLALLTGALAVFVLLTGLGIWQVQRLDWKLNLIEQAETRLAAPDQPAPAPVDWPGLTANDAEYRRVTVSGQYLSGDNVLVRAVTDLGEGFWVMTPLKTAQGWVVLVNRGFVPGNIRTSVELAPPEGVTQVSGLMRMSQQTGLFMRANRPEAERWYSRDTAAIGDKLGLVGIAPYFIDANAEPDSPAFPVAGLTVVHFRNSHLIYAITWFSLAILWAGWLIYLRRS